VELAVGRGVISLDNESPGGMLSIPPLPPPRVVPLATSELGPRGASLSKENSVQIGSYQGAFAFRSSVDNIDCLTRPNGITSAVPEGRYLVILKEEANPAQVAKEYGIEVNEGDILEGINILVTKMSQSIVEVLKKDSRIEFIEEDQGVSQKSPPEGSMISAASTPQGPDLKAVGMRVDLLISGEINLLSKKEATQLQAPNMEESRYFVGVRPRVNIDELIAEFKLYVERPIRLTGFNANLTRHMLDRLTKDTRLLLAPFDTSLYPASKRSQDG